MRLTGGKITQERVLMREIKLCCISLKSGQAPVVAAYRRERGDNEQGQRNQDGQMGV